MGFSYVFTNRKATCPTIEIYSNHKPFRAAEIPVCQSSHAYADFTIMPDLYSCTSNYVTFQESARSTHAYADYEHARSIFMHAKSCNFSRPKHFPTHKYFQKIREQTTSLSP
ncbi:hypothetical protein M9H77_02863 [Catharanthus roseus]|uniref:Uncharacterized protein n=1 Tax=Catharanthus roseus TaxID=4058 RepID=A0ACC0C9L5_CATRO|nr:hypothetical protein M9H77_02863 [Catharanthus roseus]